MSWSPKSGDAPGAHLGVHRLPRYEALPRWWPMMGLKRRSGGAKRTGRH